MLPRFSRILLVDDSAAMRKFVRTMLAEIGFENVDEAADGNEALGLIARRRYAVVISDWIMEPMSGLGLLTRLRATLAHRDLPFIMMTSQTQVKFMEIARDAGATHYLAKPFDAKALGAKLAALGGRTTPNAPDGAVGAHRRPVGQVAPGPFAPAVGATAEAVASRLALRR